MYHLSVFIHILSAICWIGGMLFTVLILVPASRHKLLRDKRGAFFTLIGRKFSRVTWVLFIVLIVTGITNLLARGYEAGDLVTGAFWQSGFGELLSSKLLLFGAVLIISGVHDFYAGPRAAQLMDEQPGSTRTRRMRALSSWLGRINLLLGLGILWYAIRLIRG